MALPFNPEIIPRTHRGCEQLLESTGYNLARLSPAQIAAIRRLYLLDDDRTVAERIQTGDITASMEDETEEINELDREDEQ